jgi:ribosome-binding factor A
MGKETGRTRRIAELLQRELADLIRREVHDPRVKSLTVTSVDVSSDLSHAKVYITQLTGVEQAAETLKALKNASGFLRHALRDRVLLRVIPQLHFLYDESVEEGAKISRLIDRALAQDSGQDRDKKPE